MHHSWWLHLIEYNRLPSPIHNANKKALEGETKAFLRLSMLEYSFSKYRILQYATVLTLLSLTTQYFPRYYSRFADILFKLFKGPNSGEVATGRFHDFGCENQG